MLTVLRLVLVEHPTSWVKCSQIHNNSGSAQCQSKQKVTSHFYTPNELGKLVI